MLYSVADGDYDKWAKPQLERFIVGFVIMLIIGFISIDFGVLVLPFYIYLVLFYCSVYFFLEIMEEELKDG